MRRLNKYDGIKTIEEYKTYYEDTSKEEILNDTYIDFINYVQLQNNWNELKEWLKEYYDYGDCLKIKFILNKMQEIESRK